MRLILTFLVVAAFCATMSSGFLFKKKIVDGCNPNPCKNKSKCTVLSINKMLSTCDCLPEYHGKTCEKKTGCSKKPCKHGTCKDDSVDPSKFHCTCEVGYVDEKCKTVNKCLKKNPCKGESVCSLDAKFKPVCACPSGFTGNKCDKRDCTVKAFKGKNFGKGQVLIAKEMEAQFKSLDSLAKLCKIKINPIKSFLLQKNPKATADYANAAYYVGRGLSFEVTDVKGKVICDQKCLGKVPIANAGAKCLIDGLDAIKFKYSVINPGQIHDGFHLTNHKAYNDERIFKQMGCELEKKFPKSDVGVAPLKVCPKGMVGDSCNKVDACAKKNPCKNGSQCTLDAKFKPVCACPPGTKGKKCEKSDCSIIQFKGKNFEKKPKVFIDADKKKDFEALDALAKKCNVIVAPLRSFSHQSNKNDKTVSEHSPFYLGRALRFELHDKKGRLLCNDYCLGKHPSPLAAPKCFMDGLAALKWQHNVMQPGVIHDNTHNTAQYNKIREYKQNGCKDLKNF